jgi:hypothetical protein
MSQVRSSQKQLVLELARRFQEFPVVVAVALGGSQASIVWAQAHCERLPREMASQVGAVLQAACMTDGGLVRKVHLLMDSLDDLLWQEGLDPAMSLPFG